MVLLTLSKLLLLKQVLLLLDVLLLLFVQRTNHLTGVVELVLQLLLDWIDLIIKRIISVVQTAHKLIVDRSWLSASDENVTLSLIVGLHLLLLDGTLNERRLVV